MGLILPFVMDKEEFAAAFNVEAMLKHVLRYMDLSLLSYIGYPPDAEVPNPEDFIEGYGKCIEDFIHETQRFGFNLRVQLDQKAGES